MIECCVPTNPGAALTGRECASPSDPSNCQEPIAAEATCCIPRGAISTTGRSKAAPVCGDSCRDTSAADIGAVDGKEAAADATATLARANSASTAQAVRKRNPSVAQRGSPSWRGLIGCIYREQAQVWLMAEFNHGRNVNVAVYEICSLTNVYDATCVLSKRGLVNCRTVADAFLRLLLLKTGISSHCGSATSVALRLLSKS